jgi:hypothetical protein
VVDTALLPPAGTLAADIARATPARPAADASGRVAQAVRSGGLRAALSDLARNPTLRHISNTTEHVNLALDAALRASGMAGTPAPTTLSSRTDNLLLSSFGKRGVGQDPLMLLDVSSRADQMGAR